MYLFAIDLKKIMLYLQFPVSVITLQIHYVMYCPTHFINNNFDIKSHKCWKSYKYKQ